jgi:hypothetical protein
MRKESLRQIYIEDELIGWIARVGAVHGVWTEWTPSGWMIARNVGVDPEFQTAIHRTRGMAIRELQRQHQTLRIAK